MDSGTTFTYLPSSAFQKFSKAIDDYAKSKGLKSTPGSDPQYNDMCWKGASDDIKKLDSVFPEVRPYQYLDIISNNNHGVLLYLMKS